MKCYILNLLRIRVFIRSCTLQSCPVNEYGIAVNYHDCTSCHAGPGPVFPSKHGVDQLRFLLPREFLRMYLTWARGSPAAYGIIPGGYAFCRESLVLKGRKVVGLLSPLYVMEFFLSIKTPSVLTDVFRGFPHYLQVTAWIVRRLHQGRLLPNPFQFISPHLLHP
jgi:hypothetical protein